MSFPTTRMRRLRRTETLRRMARETRLSRDDLILPLFVVEGSGVREAVASMPGVFRHSVDRLVDEAKEVAAREAAMVVGCAGRGAQRNSAARSASCAHRLRPAPPLRRRGRLAASPRRSSSSRRWR